MTTRKFSTFSLYDATPTDHLGRRGEITYRDGYLYYHDGVTPGGELIGGGGGSSGPTTWTSVTGKPSFATVATSGAYADLTGTPAAQILQAPQWNALHNLGTGNRYLVGDLVYDNGTIYQAILTNESQYTAVGDATYWRNLGTGIRLQTDYLDLANKPTLFDGAYSSLTGTPALFSGSYTDLTSKPVLFSGSYTDLTDKPTIPTSFSSLVNGAYTVSLSTTGQLNLPGAANAEGNNARIQSTNSIDILSNLSKWTFGTDGTLTLPSGGAVDGNFVNGQWLDVWLTAPEGATKTAGVRDFFGKTVAYVNEDSFIIQTNRAVSTRSWIFGEDGILTLPAGGTITEGGGLTGAIKLTPTGGANEYQALVIYPTGTGDGDHIHLTAGGGTTDLYLGSDLQYVKIEHSGHVVIKAADGVDGSQWLFNKNGDLTAPGNIILDKSVTTVTETETGTIADSNANPFTFRILKSANPQLVIPFADPNFVLKWTAGDAGSLAAAAQAPGGHGVSSLVSDDGTYWNFNSWYGLGGNRPNTGTVFTVEYGVVDSDTTISTTSTNLVIEADTKQYKFGTDGNITLPAGGDIVDSTGATAFVSLATLKQVVAMSADFDEFRTRIAGM